MKRRACSLAIGTALMGAMVVVGAGSASAHTPSVSATCSGVHLSATAYDSSKENHWSATIGGVTTKGTFGASLDKTIPVPQGGATTSWSATVEASDGGYSSTKSGSVGPCGSVPIPDKPDAGVETKEDVSTPNCDTLLVTTTYSSRSIPFVYDKPSNSWVPGTPGEWSVTGTQTRHVTVEECDSTQPPVMVEHRDVTDDDCTTFVTTTDKQDREAIFVFDETAWEWVQDGWTAWHTVSSDTADATLEACPPPAQPDPIVSSSDARSQKCGDDFETVTTSTSTTEYVLDEETRTWYVGEPVVVVTAVQNPVDEIECETGILGESLERSDDDDADDDKALPNTGAPSWVYGAAAGVLMLCGSLILISQRRTRTRA